MFGKSQNFDKLLDKATSHLSLEPDWPSIIKICDLIRQKDVQPKVALMSIKKKMINPNPHTALFSLSVLESCVKNCGSLIHDEIGTKMFMEQLKDLIKTTPHSEFKSKLLEMVQVWAHAFRNNMKYRAIQDTVNILKTDGYQFPTLKESDAMFVADTAPVWTEGSNCNRCRTDFSILVRKHHCRNCGQVFCSACTSQLCTLPKFGIEKEVRVCDTCFTQVTKPLTSISTKIDDLPIEYLNSSLAQQSQAPPPRKTEAELKEEEELNLAIALSQSEAENAKNKFHTTPRSKSYSPPPKISVSPEQDPELARYLNRSYWQQQSLNNSASAPSQSYSQPNLPDQNGVNETEMDEFVSTLSSQVEMFENRMKSNSSRGRPITNDSSVQTLFMNVTAMHSKLLSYIQQQDDNRVFYEGLQDKLVQIKDARAALDALREEHKEKLIREAELAERRRQMQMAEKLNLMRKKKQEYLQYQRQLALQRIQDQEREMQIRQEQQKQQYSMGSYNSLPYVPPGYNAMPQQAAMPPRFPPNQYPPFNPGAMPVDPMMPPHMGVHNMGLGTMNGSLMVGMDRNLIMPPGPNSLPRGPMIPPHQNNIPNSQHLMMPMAPPQSMNMGQVNQAPAAGAPPMSPAPPVVQPKLMMPPMSMPNQAPYMNQPQPPQQERFIPHSQSEEDTTATLISFD